MNSFEIPESPSGMFYYKDEDLLYIMCGTLTNGDQYLYVYTWFGTQECFITIPEAVGLSRILCGCRCQCGIHCGYSGPDLCR